LRDEAVIAIIVGSQEYFDQANPDHPNPDQQAPAVALSTAVSSPTHTSPIPMAVTFSKSVSGFGQDAIAVTNGTISNFTGSGAIYTFDLTPLDQGGVMVGIPAGVAQDDARNSNTAATPLSLVFDSVAPAAPALTSAANQALTGTAEAGSTVAVFLD